jgi:galactokinase
MGGGTLPGWEGVITSSIPLGASLSSSAALELATALTFTSLAGDPWDPVAAAQVAHEAETGWVGVNSGIMDQLISACGRAGRAMLLDCRDLTQQHLAVPQDVRVVVLDTGTRRTLTTSDYNQRRDECEAAAKVLGAASLRDVTLSQLDDPPDGLTTVLQSRARHVVEENRRTLAAAAALSDGDTAELGALISQSHISLRDDFDVSSDALNAMVDAAWQSPGCLGARMTGAGFAGCAIALVEEEHLTEFVAEVTRRYEDTFAREPYVFPCRAAAGASVVTGR